MATAKLWMPCSMKMQIHHAWLLSQKFSPKYEILLQQLYGVYIHRYMPSNIKMYPYKCRQWKKCNSIPRNIKMYYFCRYWTTYTSRRKCPCQLDQSNSVWNPFTRSRVLVPEILKYRLAEASWLPAWASTCKSSIRTTSKAMRLRSLSFHWKRQEMLIIWPPFIPIDTDALLSGCRCFRFWRFVRP